MLGAFESLLNRQSEDSTLRQCGTLRLEARCRVALCTSSMLLPLPGKGRRCRMEEFPDLRCAQHLETTAPAPWFPCAPRHEPIALPPPERARGDTRDIGEQFEPGNRDVRAPARGSRAPRSDLPHTDRDGGRATSLLTESPERLTKRFLGGEPVERLQRFALLPPAEAETVAHALADMAEEVDRIDRAIVPRSERAATPDDFHDALVDLMAAFAHLDSRLPAAMRSDPA